MISTVHSSSSSCFSFVIFTKNYYFLFTCTQRYRNASYVTFISVDSKHTWTKCHSIACTLLRGTWLLNSAPNSNPQTLSIHHTYETKQDLESRSFRSSFPSVQPLCVPRCVSSTRGENEPRTRDCSWNQLNFCVSANRRFRSFTVDGLIEINRIPRIRVANPLLWLTTTINAGRQVALRVNWRVLDHGVRRLRGKHVMFACEKHVHSRSH